MGESERESERDRNRKSNIDMYAVGCPETEFLSLLLFVFVFSVYCLYFR